MVWHHPRRGDRCGHLAEGRVPFGEAQRRAVRGGRSSCIDEDQRCRSRGDHTRGPIVRSTARARRRRDHPSSRPADRSTPSRAFGRTSLSSAVLVIAVPVRSDFAPLRMLRGCPPCEGGVITRNLVIAVAHPGWGDDTEPVRFLHSQSRRLPDGSSRDAYNHWPHGSGRRHHRRATDQDRNGAQVLLQGTSQPVTDAHRHQQNARSTRCRE